ncbi:hypothetical protein LTR37_021253 [Vermiconidia calcicola]|uniref:Uncharacterized protein n=1 Tax=Vermiconidia calcicola TaxID=1690605 RepID=A0ACC3M9B6_9PEZI|nr:hypothetical protein LTR37_021253 [Vermiconidia calcicola]
MKRGRSEERCESPTYDERSENCFLCSTTRRPTASGKIGPFDDCKPEECQSLGPGLLDQSKQAELLYSPIEEWQTRLLALKPGKCREPLVADLRVSHVMHAGGAMLEEERLPVDYDALFYCWGEPSFNRPVRCNGITYPITENLYLALKRLRREREVRHLCIDAVCINQHNASEKSVQVCNMLSKYQQAKTVVVWLGEHGEHTEAAIACHCASGGHAHHETLLAQLCESHQTEFSLGIHELLERPWYKRLWVKQEVWAAARIEFLCADSSIPWRTLTNRAENVNGQWHRNWLQQRRMPEHQNTVDGSFPTSPNMIAPATHSRLLANLISVMYRTSGSICSNPRDYVYGILGMTDVYRGHQSLDVLDVQATESTEPFLPVDYARPIAQVFSDVIRYYIRQRKNLVFVEFLCGEGNCKPWPLGGHVEGESLPTWCPNWSAPCEGPQQIPGRLDTLHSKNIALQTEYDASLIYGSSDTLRLSGCQLGRVVRCDSDQASGSAKNVHAVLDDTFSDYVKLVRQSADGRVSDLSQPFVDHFSSSCSVKEPTHNFDALVWGSCSPEVGDIFIAAAGSTSVWALRHREHGSQFEFVGLATLYGNISDNITPGPAPDDALVAFMQELLIHRGRASQLRTFEVT